MKFSWTQRISHWKDLLKQQFLPRNQWLHSCKSYRRWVYLTFSRESMATPVTILLQHFTRFVDPSLVSIPYRYGKRLGSWTGLQVLWKVSIPYRYGKQRPVSTKMKISLINNSIFPLFVGQPNFHIHIKTPILSTILKISKNTSWLTDFFTSTLIHINNYRNPWSSCICKGLKSQCLQRTSAFL